MKNWICHKLGVWPSGTWVAPHLYAPFLLNFTQIVCHAPTDAVSLHQVFVFSICPPPLSLKSPEPLA